MQELGRLLIVDDDHAHAAELKLDGERLGLAVETLNDPSAFEPMVERWLPSIIALDLVMPGTDGLELVRSTAAQKYPGHLILMAGGHDPYLKMAEDLARVHGLRVADRLLALVIE